MKFLVALNYSLDETAPLLWGPHPTTNGWSAAGSGVVPCATVVNGVTIPGFDIRFAPGVAGYITDATHKVLRLDSGSKTIPYRLLVAGTDA